MPTATKSRNGQRNGHRFTAITRELPVDRPSTRPARGSAAAGDHSPRADPRYVDERWQLMNTDLRAVMKAYRREVGKAPPPGKGKDELIVALLDKRFATPPTPKGPRRRDELFSELQLLPPAEAAKLAVHEYAELNAPMSDEEFAAFKAGVAEAGGIINDVTLYLGKILRGRHRCRAAVELGLPLPVKHFSGSDEQALELTDQDENRRHATQSQNAMSVALYYRARATLRGQPGPVEIFPPGVKTRDVLGRRAGVTGRYVQQALRILNHSPELAQTVLRGEKTIPTAEREVEDHHRSGEHAAAAAKLPLDFDPSRFFKLHTGDALKVLENLPRSRPDSPPRFRLIATDPPYNIGEDYGFGAKADKRDPREYLAFMRGIFTECVDLLTPDGTLVAVINHEWSAHYRLMLEEVGLHPCAWITWYEEFGVNNSAKTNFSRTSRHIHVARKSERDFVFNWKAVAVKSKRQLPKEEGGHADKRTGRTPEERDAHPGKVADDVWLDPPRLTNHSPERIPMIPNQLPAALMRRIVACYTNPGDSVLDPFNGSGTTGAACLTIPREFGGPRYYEGIDINPRYIDRARQRLLALKAEGTND
jgi:DNA modification methylase